MRNTMRRLQPSLRVGTEGNWASGETLSVWGTFTSPSINGSEVAARDKPGDMHIVSQE